ncbi:MAG: ATP-binding protein, partial [Polyangiaceae bacterium]
ALAHDLKTVWVPEHGRELWEQRSGRLLFEDMLLIARVQVIQEQLAAQRARRWLLCDTSPLTTLFYSLHMFGKADPELERLAGRHYDDVLLCAPDYEFVQDGTRQDASFRMQQHHWYCRELEERHVPFCLIEGPLDQRLRAVSARLEHVSREPLG